ncbi:hypothetical protein ACFYPN_22035 [Streptomyces sp. NPDC005576]|uniref:hypothetical protein n=1 Tax=Streptomyces sp. NPDC005576 TaxID=3364726 RepID=UPI00369D9FA5
MSAPAADGVEHGPAPNLPGSDPGVRALDCLPGYAATVARTGAALPEKTLQLIADMPASRPDMRAPFRAARAACTPHHSTAGAAHPRTAARAAYRADRTIYPDGAPHPMRDIVRSRAAEVA